MKNRTLENASAYRTYRNLYNSILRASKKLYYKDQISKNRKNPKKIWELIKEVSTGQKTTQPIEKIKINDTLIEDKQQIAKHFNNFFTKIGQEISDSVPPIAKKPSEYIPEMQNLPNLNLGNTGPVHVSDFIKAFEPKKSLDMDGMSMQLLKSIPWKLVFPWPMYLTLALQMESFLMH